MKRAIWMLVVSLVVSGVAVAGIDGTKHDLGTYDGANDRICVFCHTPHNAQADDAPLWHHSDSAASYTLYSSDTLNASQSLAGGGTSISALCMSCHDGTIALGSVQNVPRTAIADTTTKMPTTVDAYLGIDLSNDHPVSFDYVAVAAADSGIKSAGSLTKAQLFGNQVECASCHDVHDNTNVPFLIDPNTASGLCLDCHNK